MTTCLNSQPIDYCSITAGIVNYLPDNKDVKDIRTLIHKPSSQHVKALLKNESNLDCGTLDSLLKNKGHMKPSKALPDDSSMTNPTIEQTINISKLDLSVHTWEAKIPSEPSTPRLNDDERDATHVNPKWKTKTCPFWIIGKCTLPSERCKYLHVHDLDKLPECQYKFE